MRTFWSRHEPASDKVGRAAQEYGPYALVMVAVICAELVLITVALFAIGSSWSWLAALAAALAGLSTWRTRVCQRAMPAPRA